MKVFTKSFAGVYAAALGSSYQVSPVFPQLESAAIRRCSKLGQTGYYPTMDGRWNVLDPGQIAAQARSLSDRLANPARPLSPPDEAAVARWRLSAARGDEEQFAIRLRALGLDPTETLAGITTNEVCVDFLPDWLQMLIDVSDQLMTEHADLAGSPSRLGPEFFPLPELIEPLVAQAARRLAASDISWHRFTPQASGDLFDGLRGHLTGLIQRCADTEFRQYLARGTHSNPKASTSWQQWTTEQRESGLFNLWRTYPVLARMVGVSLEFWIARTIEFTARIDRDWAEIERAIVTENLADVLAVKSGLSDMHAGHASVAIVDVRTTAGDTRKLVYKPKDVSAEVSWSETVNWANSRGLDLGTPLRIVSRQNYGWVEYASHDPAASSQAVTQFYRRAGVLAALLFALGGNDCHAENLVARGDQPIIVDAETVLQPTIAGEDDVPGGPMSTGTDSLLDQLLLPRWLRVANRALDLSALGAAASGVSWQRSELVWEDPRTDNAHLVRRLKSIDVSASALLLADDGLQHPHRHVDAIVGGFQTGWDVIAANADSILSGPLASLDSAATRVLVRMTRTYSRILETALEPTRLRDGMDHSIHLEHLARSMLDRPQQTGALTLADSERDQLESGDIPFFEVRGADVGISGDDGSILLPFAESAAQRARRRIALMRQDARAGSSPRGPEFARQVNLIKASLAVSPTGIRLTELANCSDTVATALPATVATRDAANDLATTICEHVDQRTSQVLGLVAASPEQWSIDVPGIGLYDGCAGIGIALLAAARTLERSELHTVALTVLSPGLTNAIRRPRRIWQNEGIGGQRGVGGLFYAWALCDTYVTGAQADHVGDAIESLLRSADLAAVRSSADHDLLQGALGLLAGLLAIEGRGIRVPTDLRDAAVATVTDSATAYLAAYAETGEGALNGFSHGDAGLAVLLQEARQRDWGDSAKIAELVSRCLVNESSRFEPALLDWPDLREGVPPGQRGPGWCNGLPGIALSRVVMRERFPYVAPDVVAQDLERVSHGLDRDVLRRDNLCCGTAGRAEVLRMAVGSLPALAETYRETINGLATRAQQRQLRLGVPRESPISALGLFQGLSGILWALLGDIDPSLQPVLTWTLADREKSPSP